MVGMVNPPAGLGYVCGVGSRRITKNKSKQLIHFAFCNAMYGLVVVDGAAFGSDMSHFFGAKLAGDIICEYYPNYIEHGDYSIVARRMLPWNGYNGQFADNRYIFIGCNDATMQEAMKHHPNWDNLKQSVRRLMGRNEAIVKSPDLSTRPRFISCFTPDGVEKGDQTNWKTGGTGHAIRSGSEIGVRVYNIGNNATNDLICNKVLKAHGELQKKYGVDTFRLVENAIENHMPFNVIHGDIREHWKDFDIVIHGCNCQNTFGAGFAQAIKQIAPLAFEADQQTKKGDAKKLKTYTTAMQDGVRFINAYTQVFWGRDEEVLYSDYDAIARILRRVSKEYPNSRILMPKIGCGLANGCWITVSNIIEAELKNCQVTIIEK
ncbi:hypothetical protein [Photobacterium damselae]|uniref:hypothetical protein n=1 Tax=Photobacterium damselae TaxID=38293 RepID=UPI001F2D2A08|nr:hypothetical protein [Photobacterium damselae]UKA04843.1 hypothetical protein IHC89_21610 [Photobacterium damselae subsp. damselae]